MTEGRRCTDVLIPELSGSFVNFWQQQALAYVLEHPIHAKNHEIIQLAEEYQRR
jgi:hypothetical protein